ncbi:MAG: transposase [Dehalococcoidia bacterium]|nr:transposase [Dehalococcoidia bacterium]
MPFRKSIRLAPEAYSNPDNIFHVTVRAAIGSAPFADARFADVAWRQLFDPRYDTLIILAACIMPDHVHLVIRTATRTTSLVTWLSGWKSRTTLACRAAGFRGTLWQPSFWDRVVRPGELDDVIAYVVRNPVAAGLVADSGDWRWTRGCTDEADSACGSG